MNDNDRLRSRWVPPTATKESTRRGSLRGRWSPPLNRASNQTTVTFVPSNTNETSTEKKRKAYPTRVIIDTKSHWNRTNSDEPFVSTLNIRSNLGSPYMKGCETIEELIHLASLHGELLSTKHLSAFWSRVPQLLIIISSANGPPQKHEQQLKNDLHCILDITIKKLDRFSHTEIVGTILGMAKVVKHYCTCKNNDSGSSKSYLPIFQDVIFDRKFNAQTDLFQSMADISASIISLQHSEARLLSNLVYAFALIKQNPILYDGTALFDRVSKYIIDNAGSFEPQGISNVLWSYATLEVACSRLFETFAKLLTANTKLLDMFKLQHFANTVWAFSVAHISNTLLFDRVAEVVVTRWRDLRNFNSQEFSNILLAFARNSHSSPNLFTKVAQVIIAQVDLNVFNPQDLSITVWAYSTAGEPHPLLFKKFAKHIVNELGNLHDFNPQHLTNILWSYAKIGEHDHTDLFDKIAQVIIKRDLADFELRNLSIAAWAFATMNILHPTLFDFISDAAISRKCELQTQDTTNLLWAFASIGRVDDDLRLFISLLPRVKEVMHAFTCQNLANIAWAYAIANVTSTDFFDCGAFIAALRNKEHEFIDADLRQLHQWQLWQSELGSHTSLPPSLRQRCYDAFIMDRSHPSRMQNDVVNELISMGFNPQEEMLLTCSGYRLDACVLVHGEKVGIEVDGPFHFTGFKPTGHTILKRRQVKNIDRMKIVSVPYWEWEALDSWRQRQEYLSRKLSIGLLTDKMMISARNDSLTETHGITHDDDM